MEMIGTDASVGRENGEGQWAFGLPKAATGSGDAGGTDRIEKLIISAWITRHEDGPTRIIADGGSELLPSQ
jgi:hypothetical protein